MIKVIIVLFLCILLYCYIENLGKVIYSMSIKVGIVCFGIFLKLNKLLNCKWSYGRKWWKRFIIC